MLTGVVVVGYTAVGGVADYRSQARNDALGVLYFLFFGSHALGGAHVSLLPLLSFGSVLLSPACVYDTSPSDRGLRRQNR